MRTDKVVVKQSSESKHWFSMFSVSRKGQTRLLIAHFHSDVVCELVSNELWERLIEGEEVAVELRQPVLDLGV